MAHVKNICTYIAHDNMHMKKLRAEGKKRRRDCMRRKRVRKIKKKKRTTEIKTFFLLMERATLCR